MSKVFYITNDWSPQPWFSTGGTRAKKYIQSPDGRFYYFKRSQYKEATSTKPGKDYKYEFWSEVIASQVGVLLGFDMLEYNIAVDGHLIGCISESMIDSETEELIEGVKYLQAFSPRYDPSKKEHQEQYTIHLIEFALQNAKLGNSMDHILEFIVFDAIIGNGDRHQENWAVITKQVLIVSILQEVEKLEEFKNWKKWKQKIVIYLKKLLLFLQKEKLKEGKPLPKNYYDIIKRPAPIYDNGSSLGRELLDSKVELLLSNDSELNKYIDKGLAEIRWDGKKMSHFELIQNLLDSKYRSVVISIINRVHQKWNGIKVAEIIESIDISVPESHSDYKLPEIRKALIIKMITSRFEKLVNLIQ